MLSVRLAVREAVKGLRSQPHVQSTWMSAGRRAVVVIAFIAAGLAFNDLSVVVGGAFGALQVGYSDVGLPFGRLARYLAINSVALGLAVFVSASIADTWWTVLWLVGLGLLAGAFSRGTAPAISATFNALVLGIVFSGVTEPPGGAISVSLWVLAGGVAQAVVWLAWWWDRKAHVSQALVNDLNSIQRMVLQRDAYGVEVAESASVEGALQNTLRSAELPRDSAAAAVEVAAWTALVRRAAITWIEVRDPGPADRQQVVATVLAAQHLVAGRPRATWRDPTLHGDYACVHELLAALAGLRSAIDHWRSLRAPMGRAPFAGGADVPRHLAWRHAVRVAVAVGVAQAISLPMASDHSFWIPLTVAFIVRPDWAFTVLRTLLRLIGTVGAVAVVGFSAAWLIGHPGAYVGVAFVLVLITLRWTTGNYAIAAFAVTGFILLIDSSVDIDDNLPVERLVFTVAGSVIGLAASLLVPNWVSRDVPSAVRNVMGGLRDVLPSIFPADGQPSASSTYVAGLQIRDALEQLRVVAVGTALEPHARRVSTAALLDLLDRGQVVLIRLWALGTYELMSARTSQARPMTREAVSRVQQRLDEASRLAGAPDVARSPKPANQESQLPQVMAQMMTHGMQLSNSVVTAEEASRVALLAAELERDVVRLSDSVRDLGLSRDPSKAS